MTLNVNRLIKNNLFNEQRLTYQRTVGYMYCDMRHKCSVEGKTLNTHICQREFTFLSGPSLNCLAFYFRLPPPSPRPAIPPEQRLLLL